MASYMYNSSTGRSWSDEEDEGFDFEAYTAAAVTATEYCVAERCTSPFPSMRPTDVPYLYVSPTGSNWDDDEENYIFDPEEFSQSRMSLFDAIATPQTAPAAEKAIDIDQDSDSLSPPAQSSINVDEMLNADFYPNYAQKMTQKWYFTESLPAYPELSHDEDDCYPHVRVQYTSNWTATKLSMGANLRYPMMMKSSLLRLSSTWAEDEIGEYVENRGFWLPPAPQLALMYDSTSDEEKDEVCTPPGSPPMADSKDCKIEVEEYDPITGAIDLPAHSAKAMEVDLSREFDELRVIFEGFDVADIEDDFEKDVEKTFVPKNQSVAVEPYTPHPDNNNNLKTNPAPDFRCIHELTNTSLVMNTVTAGWFALSCLPWGRIAVATAGALFDVVSLVAR